MTKRYLLALLGCVALALTAAAQDEAPDPPVDQRQAPEPPAQQEPAAEDEEDPRDVDEEEFIFSEEIPVDQQVTFPVDI
jgi:hypothetical protein